MEHGWGEDMRGKNDMGAPPARHGSRNPTCFEGGKFQASPAHAWKPVLGCLKTHATFTTCCSNTVKGLLTCCTFEFCWLCLLVRDLRTSRIPLEPHFEESSLVVTLNYIYEFIFWELHGTCFSYITVDGLISYH